MHWAKWFFTASYFTMYIHLLHFHFNVQFSSQPCLVFTNCNFENRECMHCILVHCTAACCDFLIHLTRLQICRVQKRCIRRSATDCTTNFFNTSQRTAFPYHTLVQFSTRWCIANDGTAICCQMFRSNLPRQQFFTFSLICLAQDSS